MVARHMLRPGKGAWRLFLWAQALILIVLADEGGSINDTWGKKMGADLKTKFKKLTHEANKAKEVEREAKVQHSLAKLDEAKAEEQFEAAREKGDKLEEKKA